MSTIIMRFCKMHNCSRAECKDKHVITDDTDHERIKNLFETMYDDENNAETDIEYRGGRCYYGFLCCREECFNTHFCNYEFRVELNKEWKKINKAELKKSTCCQS